MDYGQLDSYDISSCCVFALNFQMNTVLRWVKWTRCKYQQNSLGFKSQSLRQGQSSVGPGPKSHKKHILQNFDLCTKAGSELSCLNFAQCR